MTVRGKSALLGASLLVFGNLQAGNIDGLTEALIRLRSEVEELQNQLDLEKEKHKNNIEVLSSQLSELSVENRRQRLAVEQLQQTLEEHKQQLSQAQTGEAELLPVMLAATRSLKKYVQTSLPFKTESRLAELTQLENQLQRGLLDPKKSANRIWAFIEDEIRLSKENGIYRQTIPLEGENKLAEVAKLGMVMLYFKTADGRTGMAQKNAENWHFRVLNAEPEQKLVAQLFDALKKQIRQGYFELPNPLES